MSGHWPNQVCLAVVRGMPKLVKTSVLNHLGWFCTTESTSPLKPMKIILDTHHLFYIVICSPPSTDIRLLQLATLKERWIHCLLCFLYVFALQEVCATGLVISTFLKRSLCDLFWSGAFGFVTGQVLCLCEASSEYARVFIWGVPRRHGYSQRDELLLPLLTKGHSCARTGISMLSSKQI